MVNILIGQLPADVTESMIRQRLNAVVDVKELKLVREGNAENVTAVVGVDASRPAAEYLVRRINGLYFQGRRLRAYMTVFP